MDRLNSLEEAINFAIKQEIQAAELYDSLLNLTSDPKAKEICAELRDMELKHKANLENFDTVEFKTRHTDQALLDLKLTDYLVEMDTSKKLSFQEILIVAAQREQRAVALYTKLADQFSFDVQLTNLFSLLVREEQLHKDQVETLYDDTILSQN